MQRLLPYYRFILTASLMAILVNIPCQGMVAWPPASSVTDENIQINRNVRLPQGTTTITASGSNTVTVSLNRKAAITGNECANATLDLVTDFTEVGTSTISFDVSEYDLTFRTAQNIHRKHNKLFIERIGGGVVQFIIANDHTLTFDAHK